MPELELTVGEVHELELRGLGSAGYSWEAAVEGPAGVVEIRRAPSGPLPRPAAGGKAPDTMSLPELFQIDAVGVGRVTARFALRRSWEPEEPPLEESALDVIVTA